MKDVIIGISSLLIAIAVGFFVGQRITTVDYELQIAELNAKAQEAEIKAQSEKDQIELQWQRKVNDVTAKAYLDKKDIESHYQSALSELNDSLLNAESGSTDTTALSNDTNTTTGTTANSKCGCSNKNLKAIKADLLMIARDCDITATHYNELLGIYQGLQ